MIAVHASTSLRSRISRFCGRSPQRGMTPIEVLIVGLVLTMVGVGLYTLVRSTYDAQYLLLNQNSANANSRSAIDTLADQLRGANGLTAATASDITFTDSTGTVRYWLSGGNLVKTVNGLPAGGTTVQKNVTALTFLYQTYSSGWTSSAAPATPANVGAVTVTATVSIGGATRQTSSLVRLRMK